MVSRGRDHFRRRGITVVLVTVVLFVLMGFAAFAIDVGHICAVAAEMQNTADGAALAGASALRDQLPDLAKHRALFIIDENQKRLGFRSLKDQVIELGQWNSLTGEFTPLGAGDIEDVFAVRVVSLRADTPYFFAPFMGLNATDVLREAVAVGSGSCGGIWGLNGVAAGGGLKTDSYNSEDGPFSEITAGENGDVCSGRHIDVGGSFEVNGDVMSGFGYEVTVAGNSGDITGITTSSLQGVVAPSAEFGDIRFANDNDTIGLTDNGQSPWKRFGWNMSIQGQDNLNIEPGRYLFASISLSGGAQITVTGPTTFYVRGPINSTGGNVVNATGDPKNLTIISRGTEVKISGGSGFYGSILAPRADVKLGGNAEFYGAVVGGTVKIIGDIVFHVDESLPLSNWWTPPPPMLVQ